MSDDDLRIVIEGDDDTERPVRSNGKTAEEWQAETARHLETVARSRREIAANRVNAALLTIDSESRAAKSEYSRKMEEGDWDAAAEAQARLAAAEARRAPLQAQAEAIQRRPTTLEEQYTPATADWLRRHPEWTADPRKSAKLQGAHHMAVGDGLTPDTPEYFEHVEKTIGLRGGGSDVGGRGAAGRPVSSNSGQVKLTKGEAERANDGSIVWNFGPNKGKPIGNVEYARRKIEMQKSGMYTRLD